MDQNIKQNRKIENSTEPLSKRPSSVILISFWKSRKNLLFLAGIMVISFIVYLPCLQNGFVNYDDQLYIHKNPYIVNISSGEDILENLKGIFTTHVIGGYTPLVVLSFAFEKILYGLDRPEWWHLNNIILHLICVLLVFRIALALGLKIIPAAFCALLFGIHPMRVQSVAWVTERKDLLYGSFYLLALYYYIKSVKLSFQKRYVSIIFLSFILALLSKIQAVSLPLSMLLVDYYFDRKLSLKLVYEKWLYFLLSLATGIAGNYYLGVFGGVLELNETHSLFNRIFFSSYSFIVYMIKSVVPYEMVAIYPFHNTLDWKFYASMVLALSILGSIYYYFRKQKKVLVFGLLFFTFNIMFVLQIKIGGLAFLADRLTYIAYFGLFFIYSFGIQWLLGKYEKYDKLLYLTAILILSVFGYLNFEQNKIWKNGETLWSHALKYYPNYYYIWDRRADFYRDKGRLTEALNDYTKSITFNPSITKSYIGRGVTYIKLNMFDNALQDFNMAEKINPMEPLIYYNRPIIYQNRGQHKNIQADLEKYVRFNQNNPKIWSNLGTASRHNKQYEKSLNAFNRAIQIAPNKLDNYFKRSITYYEMGDLQKSRKDLDFLKSKGFTGINPEFESLIYKKK